MSLVDGDKLNVRRTAPRVNSSDDVTNRMAHNTMSNTYRASGGSVTPRMVFKNSIIMWVDSNDKVSSVYGYIPEISSIPVQIIAKQGFDVFLDVLNGEVERPRV